MTDITHVDAQGRPTMVDVSAKAVTLRSAVAESRVRFPAAVAAHVARRWFRHQQGPGVPHRDRGRRDGRQAHARADSLLSPARPRALRRRHRHARRRSRRPLHGLAAPQDGRRNGGPDRRLDRRTHDLRHVQGAVARDRHRRDAVARKARRQARRRTQASRNDDVARTTVRPGAGGRRKPAHGTGQGRPRPARSTATRLGVRHARSTLRARVRLDSRRPAGRPGAARPARDRRRATTAPARSPASPRRKRRTRTTRGSCWPATCPSSTMPPSAT